MYLTGYVYKIINNKDDKIYIGSTFKSINKRFQDHKSAYKNMDKYKKKAYISSFELFKKYGVENCSIELIKKYQVIDKKHLETKEQLWIYKYRNNTVNKCSEFSIKKLTYKNQYLKNKVYYKEYYKKYYKEKSIKYTCECSSVYIGQKARHEKSAKHQNFINNKSKN